MNIQTAIIEDAKEILVLQKLAFQVQAELYNDYSLPPLVETLQDIRDSFANKSFLKMVYADKIIGSVRIHEKSLNVYEIGRLITHPDYRRRGIATELMTAAQKLFPRAKRFEQFTGHKSQNSINLYKKLGYTIYKTGNKSDYVPLVFMEKIINKLK